MKFRTKSGTGINITIDFVTIDTDNKVFAYYQILKKDTNDRLRIALEGVSDGLWDWNLMTNEVYYSPTWEKMLGYEAFEPENKFEVWETFTNLSDVKSTMNMLNRYIEGKTDKFCIEFKMKHKKGHWIDILSRAILVKRNIDEKPYRSIGTHVNITKQKKNAEVSVKALGYSRKRQSEISEFMTATHSILNSSGFNQSAHEIFQACKRFIGIKAGYVALMSDDGKENNLLFLDDGGLPCSVNSYLPMPIRGLRAEAYRTGQVVYDNNFMESKWMKFMPKGHVVLPNVLFAPLIIHGKTVGVFGISNRDIDFTKKRCHPCWCICRICRNCFTR